MNHNPPLFVGPCRLESPSGLTVRVNSNGSIQRLDHADILLNLFLGNEVEGGPANLYLRRQGKEVAAVPLLGPLSPSAVCCDNGSLTLKGEWQGIHYVLALVLAKTSSAWFWQAS